jgi:hypothetical protein
VWINVSGREVVAKGRVDCELLEDEVLEKTGNAAVTIGAVAIDGGALGDEVEEDALREVVGGGPAEDDDDDDDDRPDVVVGMSIDTDEDGNEPPPVDKDGKVLLWGMVGEAETLAEMGVRVRERELFSSLGPSRSLFAFTKHSRAGE